MTKSKTTLPELVAAAEAVEAEVRRFEEVSSAGCKIRLNTEKSLSKAARALNDALAHQERIAEQLRVLAEAMVNMQKRQEKAAEALAARAVEIRDRTASFSEQMRRFALLGEEAGKVTLLLHDVGTGGATDADDKARTANAARMAEVDVRMTQLIEQARELAASSRAEDMPEISRQAESLQQQIASAHARLGLAKRALRS